MSIVKLKLDQNERVPPLGKLLSEKIGEHLGLINQYGIPEKYYETKHVLAEYSGVKPDNVILTNGSFHALELLTHLYLDRQNSLVTPVPTFPFYTKYENEKKIKVLKVEPDSVSINGRRIIDCIDQTTKLIYLANPNNPLGYTIDQHILISIIEECRNKDIMVVIDEAYFEYSHQTMVSYISTYKNLIILRTMSKAFGLAGIKLGYVIAETNTAKKIEQFRGPIAVLNGMALNVVPILFQNIGYVYEYVKEINHAKEYFLGVLNQLGIEYFPTEANFVTVKVANAINFCDHLQQQGILTRSLANHPDGSPFTDNCIRITLAPKSSMEHVSQVMHDYLK